MGKKNRRQGAAHTPLQLLRTAGWERHGREPRCAECASYAAAPGATRVAPGQGACARTGLPQVPDGICLEWRGAGP